MKIKMNLLPKKVTQHFRKNSRGQSFVELALVVPILLLILLGLVEVAFFMGRYLDALDLTREAARFASGREPYLNNVANPRPGSADYNCSTPDNFDFYYDTACIFSPPETAACTAASDPFCNGFNSFVEFNQATDDVVISVFTIESQDVKNRWPAPNGWWALSNVDADATHNDNFKRNCQGDVVRTEPYYTDAKVDAVLAGSGSTTPKKGYVAVEFYYCYSQVLNLPIFTDLVPNPMQIHAYTFMPLPAAQPTRVP
ncbi:MAG: hypothetical protein CVU46_11230 [Chloroflexi bacterium HGW-Chloroflexi-8]|nr:MAG: hypothetical protein CVU46_11230 [Chloroflexi bacterium HGW-Chloroflexi-8]